MDEATHITDNVDHKDVAMQALAEKITILQNQLYYAKNDLQWEQNKSERLEEKLQEYKRDAESMSYTISDLHEHYRTEKLNDLKANAALTPEQLKFLMDPSQTFLAKINAIKAVRSVTKLGLKEAKEFMDDYFVNFKEFLSKLDIEVLHSPGDRTVEFYCTRQSEEK